MSQAELESILKSNAEALSLGKSLRDSGVNAMFMGDSNHESEAVDDSMALTAVAFKPDLMFVEAKNGATETMAEVVGAEVVPIDPWTNKQKEHFYELQEKQGKALDTNAEYTKKYDEAMKSGNTEKAGEYLKGMQESKAQYNELYGQTSGMLKERQGDAVNNGMAEKIADKIEEFHKEHGRMPRFSAELGDGHIVGRNDVDEMVVKKLEDRGLPTEQYKNHKEIEFKESDKVDKVEVDKKLLGEHEYTVSVPPKDVPDVRGQEQQQSQGYSR